MRKLNFRFLAYLLGAVVLLAPGVHFLHGYQVKRNAGIFLDQAEKAEGSGELQKAADYYRRYLGLDPSDKSNALAKYGTLLMDKRLANSGKALAQAYFVLEQALRRDPDRHDVRKQVIRLAMQFGRHTDALEHLNILQMALGEDGELLKLRGYCYAAVREFKKARQSFEKALTYPPKDPSKDFDTYLALATLLREQGSAVMAAEKELKDVHKKADETIETMLKAFDKSFGARLAAARYYRQFAPQIALQIGAEASEKLIGDQIVEARNQAPDELDVILAFAGLEQERKNVDRARAELERGMKLHQEEWPIYQALAHLEMLDAKPEAALAVLRRGLEKLPEQLDLLWNLAHLYAHQGRSAEANEMVARLQKQGFPRTELDYLEARIQASQEEWQDAARLLEKIYPLLAGRADQQRDWLAINLVYESNLLLARCYEQLGDPDAAASAYTRVVTRFPQSNVGRLGLARMEWALGRLDSALREYDVLMSSAQAPVQAWIESIQLRIESNLKRPQPDWSEVDRMLSRMEQLKPVPVEVGVLRAEFLAAKKEFDKARAALEKGHEDKQVRPVEVWIGLAGLEQQREKSDVALALLNEAERHLGDRLELRQARCRYWARRGGPEAPRALDQVNLGLDKFPAEQQRRLLPVLAGSYLQIGEVKRAEALWQQIAKQYPKNLRSQMALFDLALQDNESAAMDKLVEAIKFIEGPEGTIWRYCQACQLIAQAQKSLEAKKTLDQDSKRLLDRASEQLLVVAKRRPTWGRVMVAQGQVNDLLGLYDAALDKYQKGMAFGEQSFPIIRRTLQLLWSRGNYAEVEELLQTLPVSSKGTLGELDRIGAESALRSQDPARALVLAERAVPADSKDYQDHVWLAQIKWRAGKNAEAETELRHAIKLAPDVPETWVAMVAHYIRIGEKTKANQTVEEAAKQLPRERSRLALARCYEMTGQTERSKELYAEALAANPNDSDVLEALAFSTLSQNQRDEAKKYFEQLISLKNLSPARLAAAKRALALVLSSPNDYQETVKALRLLGVLDAESEKLPPATGENLADQRAKIVILARAQNPRQRRQAISLLEGLLGRQQITSDERFLLAQLYESVGEWPKARQQFQFVLSAGPEALGKDERGKDARLRQYADKLTVFCVGLLRADAATQVEPWLAKLEEIEPKSLRSVGLRAQLLSKQGQADKAVPELLAFEKNQDKLTGSVAAVLEQIGQLKLAEEMYKKYVTQSMKPEANLTLAQFYGRQNRPDEALALCQSALKTCRMEQVASAAVLVLYTAKVNNDHCQRVAGWLQAAIQQNEKATELMTYLAAVRRLQKDYQSVIALYRQVLKHDPNDTLTLNNLAWLLALSERSAPEALTIINRAIELDGPQSELLDTRGVAYLINQDPKGALRDFEEAIAETPTAHRYFHLAQAHFLARNRSAAVDALQKAMRLKLTENTVDPLEISAYQQLHAELNVKSTAAR